MNDVLFSNMPASWYGDLWKDAFPSGNGKTGISVYGAVKKETILVNHGNLWHWGKRSSIPDVSEAFLKTKKLLKKGEYQQADPLTSGALTEAGYEAELYKPCPVGDILIRMTDETAFSDYRRSLDMSTGEVTVSWKAVDLSRARRCFVSREKDIIVLRIEASGKRAGFNVGMQLHETFGGDSERMKKETRVSYSVRDGLLCYKAENEENQCFGIACTVLDCDGKTVYDKDRILIDNASDTTLIFKVFGEMDRTKTEQEAASFLQDICRAEKYGYDRLRTEHEKKHGALYRSAGFELEKENTAPRSNEELLYSAYRGTVSNELYEKLWKYGRYLFISGTGPDLLPFNMYGLWGGRYDLLWSHNMANINIQMMYWHCVTGGYADHIRALIDYFHDLMPDFRENAAKIFGLEGIMVTAGTTPGYGVMNQVVPVIVNWIGGAGWIAQHMYDYYLATGDEETLREKILPFMKEAALFYEGYLSWEEDGCHIVPSVSPENTPGNLQSAHLLHMAHANPTAMDATMDVAILKEFFSNLIEISEKLAIFQDKLPEWTRILKSLPDYQINEDGAVKEWLAEGLTDFYYHRHLSHLYPLFPGREMLQSRDPLLFRAFKRAVRLRVQGGQSGWSLAFMACLYARLKDGNRALGSVNTLIKSCLTNSLFSLHNDWRNMGLTLDLDEFDESDDRAPVQLDADLGLVNAFQEMILQYVPGGLFLLPALPDRWNAGSVSRFVFFGGELSMEWNKKNAFLCCQIKSRVKQCLKISIPKAFLTKPIEIITGKGSKKTGPEEDIEIGLEKNEAVKLICQ